MSSSKWKAVYLSSYHDDLVKNTSDFFKAHLIDYLKQEHDPNGEKNQPDNILIDATKEIGSLSRLFDAFKYPVPSYELMQSIYEKPDGLREYMQKTLDHLLPILLNKDGTALHQDIINAIGEENYAKMKAINTEQEIAKQVVNAVFVSFPQRIIDNTPEKTMEIFSTISVEATRLSNKVTLQGLPQQSELKPEELTQMLNEFKLLLDEADKIGIKLPNANKINEKLDLAAQILDPNNEDYAMIEGKGKLSKALSVYDEVVDHFVSDTQKVLAEKPVEPKEANWFKKVLRFITGNEKLLQNSDEKRYDREMDLHQKIDQLNEKITVACPEEQLAQHNETPDQEEDHRSSFTM